EHRAVAPAIEANAGVVGALGHEALRLVPRHPGQVVDVLLAVCAETDTVVARHGIPGGAARARHTNVFEKPKRLTAIDFAAQRIDLALETNFKLLKLGDLLSADLHAGEPLPEPLQERPPRLRR